MKKISLYIHIPFCKQKCFYCDFPSYQGMEGLVEEYVNALCIEIENIPADFLIRSIFIGGGTPTYLSGRQIERILKAINKLNVMKDMEFTMECNPGTLNEEKLTVMKTYGVNRLSIGLQAVQDSLLNTIGRIHTYNEFEENFRLARKIGFNNINVDLMYGLPNQTVEEWSETLEKICGLNPEHISAYSLIIEEGTCFYKMWDEDKLNLPTEDEERKMDAMTRGLLERDGYKHYEISNYSKKGYECNHNKVYWKCKEYLGAGVSSSSFIDGARIKNIDSIKGYIDGIKNFKSVVDEKYKNKKEDDIEEFMFMGLRMVEGIRKVEFEKRFNEEIYSIYGNVIEENIRDGLMKDEGGFIRLTDRGIEVSNLVMAKFILEK